MELRGYKMETDLGFEELYAKFTHHFSSKGWTIGRWTDYEIIARDGKAVNWAWAILVLFNLLAIFPLFLYWLIAERHEIRITRGQGSTYYVAIKGSKAKEEFNNFAFSIRAITHPTYKDSKTTAGEGLMYLTLVLTVMMYIVLFLALL